MPSSETLNSAGNLHQEACRLLQARNIDSALRNFVRAEKSGFDPDECASGRWVCHMLAGDFERAWRESDAISERGAPDPNRLWSGYSLEGKKVVVRCLHGLGDAIQIIRFAPLLRAQTRALFVEVPACLVRLFRTLPSIDEVITWEPPPAPFGWDDHIEVMELPRYFRATADSVPRRVPYLFPPAIKPIELRETTRKATTKVGLVWKSSAWNPDRSIPLHLLTGMLSLTGCSFVSLQKDDAAIGYEGVPASLFPQRIIGAGDDVLATASLIAQLDLVITVDTMVAHLAGALGRPVWLMLTQPADWRWMLQRSDSPWYPTMRIFRQSESGNWMPVIRQVADGLSAHVRSTG